MQDPRIDWKIIYFHLRLFIERKAKNGYRKISQIGLAKKEGLPYKNTQDLIALMKKGNIVMKKPGQNTKGNSFGLKHEGFSRLLFFLFFFLVLTSFFLLGERNVSADESSRSTDALRSPTVRKIKDDEWKSYKETEEKLLARESIKEDYFIPDDMLASLIEKALDYNPALKKAEASWQAAMRKVPQVSAYPDPVLSVTSFLKSIETRVGPQEAILGLSQKFPWFGKLSSAGRMAFEEALSQAWLYRALQRETVKQVKGLYYDLFFVKRAIEINKEELELLRRFENISMTKYSTGKGIQQNVVKVQTEITKVMDKDIQLRQRQESLSRMMRNMLGEPFEMDTITPPDMDISFIRLDLDTLYHTAQENHQELQALLHAIEKYKEKIKLAKKQYYPDLTLGFNYFIVDDREDNPAVPPPDDGEDAYNVVAKINIPLWYGKLNAGVEEARLGLESSRKGYENVENRILFEIQDLFVKLQSVMDMLDLYRTTLIPQAEQSLRSAESAYQTGELSFLDLLDSERVLLSVKLGYERLKADYFKNLAAMERALGTKFPVNQTMSQE